MYYIYKYYHDDELLYIGKTNDLWARYKQHKNDWERYNEINKIMYTVCNTKDDMDMLEKLLIRKYKPVLNKAELCDNTSLTIAFEEPAFSVFTKEEMNKRKKEDAKQEKINNNLRHEKKNKKKFPYQEPFDLNFWSQIYKYILEAYLMNSEHTNIIDVRMLGIGPEEFKEKISYTFLPSYEIDGIEMLGINGYSSSSKCPYIFSLMYDMNKFRDNFEVWHAALSGTNPNEISGWLREDYNRKTFEINFRNNPRYDIWKKIYSLISKAAKEGKGEIEIRKDAVNIYELEDVSSLNEYSIVRMHDQACVHMFGITNYSIPHVGNNLKIRFSEEIYWEYYDVWRRGFRD